MKFVPVKNFTFQLVALFLLALAGCTVPPAFEQQPVAPTTLAERSHPPSSSARTAPSSSTVGMIVPVPVREAQPLSKAQQTFGVYPVPPSCAVTPFAELEERKTFPAWWLDGNGIALGTPLGVLFEGWNKLQWHLTEAAALTISGERLDMPAQHLNVDFLSGIGTMAAEDHTYSSGIIFPAPGCWIIRGDAGQHQLEATVYVYPFDCKPHNLRETSEPKTPVDCVLPQE